MNKELIKKYNKEFNHWLNGGNILARYSNLDVNDIWTRIPLSKYGWNTENTWFVIEDKYVEFRKALAEGKTVQCRQSFSKEWKNVFYPRFDTLVENYRIKPEEPKFKVGDWVRDSYGNIQLIERILPCDRHKENIWFKHAGAAFSTELKHWTPQPGEWCWFWDAHHTIPVIRRFKKEADSEYPYKAIDDVSYENCEPFIGTLPTHLKDIE